MKIALIGASGYVGSKVLKEALERGHDVTAIVRHPERLTEHPHLKSVKGDIKKDEEMAQILAGHDVVVTTVHYDDGPLLLREIKKSGVKRFVSVGGAGSLEVKAGIQFVDTPEFPEIYLKGAQITRDFYELVRKDKELDWTIVTPSAELVPGERTGQYRIGHDNLLFNNTGKSTVSVEDLAHAMLEEIENPQFIRKRFTVGY
jgi:hypothetical protein